MLNTSRLIGDQLLVECVQTVLPNCETETLLVLARPYAYAMRGLEPQNAESTISDINNREWTVLSEIEQAKVSLAIAHYAFTHLNNLQSET